MIGQLGKRDLQRFTEAEHGSQRRALDAPFKKAYISPIEVALEAELFLRQTSLLAQLPECLSEGLLGSRIGLNMPATSFHRQVYRAILWIIVRRTIVRI
jgi:hypothetical protein